MVTGEVTTHTQWNMKTCIIDMLNDLQVESYGWLFKSPLAGGGHIVEAKLQAAQLVQAGSPTSSVRTLTICI